MEMIKRFFKDESGATMVEYAVLVALISIAVIVTVVLIGTELNNLFNIVVDCITVPRGALCPAAAA